METIELFNKESFTPLSFVNHFLSFGKSAGEIVHLASVYEEMNGVPQPSKFQDKVKFILADVSMYSQLRDMTRKMLQSNFDRGLNTQSEDAKALASEFGFGLCMTFESEGFLTKQFEGIVDEFTPMAWDVRHIFDNRQEWEAKIKQIKEYGN